MAKWWQERVIYQIYPRSFCDSNGDGVGDIPGIISKLDYLKELGVGAIWLSPIYVSPNYDYGYDVADYYDVNPEYGTLEDVKQLFIESKKRDIKVIFDMVINHTSDQHAWFQASRNPLSEYRDYYIWQKPKRVSATKDKPPNNWTSFFTGSAWTKDNTSGEFYLHLFSKHQPDLNYDNPAVIEEFKRIMRFWLDLGVDGFRLDVINLIHKQSLANGRRRLIGTGSEHYLSTKGCHKILQHFAEEIWLPKDVFILGEAHNATLESAKQFVDNQELSMIFYFDHMIPKPIYSSEKAKKALIKWQKGVRWNPVFFENHDGLRSISRFGNDGDYRRQSATMLATLLVALRGTPIIYQGQEIGMSNVPFTRVNQLKDIISLSVYKILRKYWIPPSLSFKLIMWLCRDHARTPMQWENGKGAGFTSGKPWIMLNPNYKKVNVEDLKSDPVSIWSFYHKLIQLRSKTKCLRHGDIEFLNSPKGVMIFDRVMESERYRIVINMDAKIHNIKVDLNGVVLTSNYGKTDYSEASKLWPYEAAVIRVSDLLPSLV